MIRVGDGMLELRTLRVIGETDRQRILASNLPLRRCLSGSSPSDKHSPEKWWLPSAA
jgi:hypothetical protein